MDLLYFIKHYSFILFWVNVLAMMVGVLLLLPVVGRWREYLIAIYGGFLFGMVPFYYLSENMVFVVLGCIVLSILFVFIHDYYGKKISLPFVVAFFQMLLILGVLIWYDAYSSNPFEFYLTFMLLSVILSVGMHLLTDLTTEKWSRIICPIFGIVVIAAAVMHFYRMDYDYFGKYLPEESVPFFLNLLGIDFGIFDYQYPFLFLVVALLMVYGFFAGVFLWVKKQRKSRSKYDQKVSNEC